MMDEGSIYGAFGRAVADRRVSLSKTQEQVAAAIGLSRASLANIERGKQKVFLHQILALVDALELDSSHEIVPERAVTRRVTSKSGITMSGAKNLSKDQKNLVNSIVESIAPKAQARR